MTAQARLLPELVEHWAEVKPDAEAISYEAQGFTWQQWRDRIRKVAGALRRAGVGRGDRVAYLDKNNLSCLEVILAAGSLGAATAILNWRLAPDELDYVVRDSGAKMLFVADDLLPGVKDIADRPTTILLSDYEELIADADPVAVQSEVRTEDPVLVMYSSGTTGRPKGVLLSHANVLAHARNTGQAMPVEDGFRSLVAMPLFHVGGSCYAMSGFCEGIPSTLLREPSGPGLLGAIAQGCTHAFLVPAVVAGIMAAGQPAITAFGRLKRLIYGASPMPLPLLRAAMAAWPDTDFVQVYGMTEMAGAITVLSPEDHRDAAHPERLTSAGRPIAGAELRVVDPATGEDAEVGELWFRTPQTMLGYLGQPAATADTITADGWLRTGDVGRLDDGGYVYIVDRVKDMIITGGENVYSPEVERVLAEHPAVADVAVIGVPDDRWGESVKAVVQAADGQTVDPEELVAYARERLAGYKVPRTIDVVEEMPRNATGKILKKVLRRPYWPDRAI
ncbi:long-chain-fatty-acid--CoA ligase [Kutzneria kofuensis]|uniref:Acyl-CoA synthetase (AMP-forming)/AMP-acid ligase II n=1 Tax=Kutzneria kofuensis TaxID=103725 RepID=A0A7W9NF12_9PSEU|nr:long-chain-fatty-acid--CoA ligase [Kutzneria kofuensis]MBB5889626.1 acyl-CoA synthetase (AMP-forming)/AMP-acid ligase II [Kutzneria kofuensis]